MTPICINIVQLTGQLTDRSNILRCQLGSDEWQIGKREKGTSIALPFTKELQEMNEDFYSVEISNHHLCHVIWLYFDL